MINLMKPVIRVTRATAFERSKRRPIIVILDPPAQLGFRLKGTRRTYYIDVESCYSLAVKAQLASETKEKRKSVKEKKRTRKSSKTRRK